MVRQPGYLSCITFRQYIFHGTRENVFLLFGHKSSSSLTRRIRSAIFFNPTSIERSKLGNFMILQLRKIHRKFVNLCNSVSLYDRNSNNNIVKNIFPVKH